MPPSPIWPVISYGPSRVPGANDTVTRLNYTGMPRREGIRNDQRRSGFRLQLPFQKPLGDQLG